MPVPHQEMTTLYFLFSLDHYSLCETQHFFYQFIFQSNICFGMVMIGRYDNNFKGGASCKI